MRSKIEKSAVPDTDTKAVRRKKVSAIKTHRLLLYRQDFDKNKSRRGLLRERVYIRLIFKGGSLRKNAETAPLFIRFCKKINIRICLLLSKPLRSPHWFF